MKKSRVFTVCYLILTATFSSTHSGGENVFECLQNWKWKCPNEDKCIIKDRQVCDGVLDCKDGADEAICSSQFCASKFFEFPKWKCTGMNVTKCIPFENVCDGTNDCNHAQDEGEICMQDFCKATLNRHVCPKPGGNVCSRKENICKNCQRDFHCNEYNCTENFCSKTFSKEKMSCPDEKRCIGKKFACDGKLCRCHCLSRCDCENCNDWFEDSEEFCHSFCGSTADGTTFACPYQDHESGKIYAQCTFDCHIPDHISSKSFLIETKSLWECPALRSSTSATENVRKHPKQFIEIKNVCDGVPQCNRGQDESVLICGAVSFYSVVLITAAFVVASSISVYYARKSQLIPLKCRKCDKPYRKMVKMRHKKWKIRRKFLSLILGNDCTELAGGEIRKEDEYSSNETIEIENFYISSIHNKENISDIYFYVVRRIDSMFTLINFQKMIQEKHLLMKKVYELELKIHKNNHKGVVKCLKSQMGASAETDAILNFRKPPTLTKKIICFIGIAIKRIHILRLIISFVKVITLTFDLIRDYILLYEMGKLVINSYDGGSGDYVTTNDFIILSSFIVASFYAHIFIGIYVYHNRFLVLSTCSHDPSKKSEIILFGLCTLAFPLLGAATVTINYLEQYNLEKDFKTIHKDDKEWKGRMISKTQFQNLLIQKYRICDLIKAGFPTIKVIESTLESYYQILIILVLFFKDAYDGVLNQELIGMGAHEISVKRLVFFVGTSGLSFVFLAWSIVDFISKHQGDSISIVGKIILLHIYIFQVFLSLLTTLSTSFTRMEHGDMFPLYLNISIAIIKMLILIIYRTFQVPTSRRSLSSLAVFVLPNVVTPIPFGPIRGGGSQIWMTEKQGFINLLRLDELKILWILTFCELFGKVLIITFFATNESLSPLHLSKQYIWIITIVVFGGILILWKLFFHYAYLFKDILYDTEELEEDIEKLATENIDINVDEEDPLQNKMKSTKVDKYANTSKSSTSPFSFLMCIISVLGIIVTIVSCYPSIRSENHIYKDCDEIHKLNLTDGIYKIYNQKRSDENNDKELKFTRCENGKTLIQQTNPDGGNKRLFFQRPMQEYINGFGSTSRDYFIGLETISYLINNGNSLLTLQATTHNGSNLEISFQNVQINKEIQDNYPYFGTQRKDKSIQYALRYDHPQHGYILIRPNYMKSIENKTERKIFHSFEDFHFSGFTAPDSLQGDNVCAHRFKSGWWFPLRYTKTFSDQPLCAHNPFLSTDDTTHKDDHENENMLDLSTNLNGVYREDEDKNERGIVYCENMKEAFDESKMEKCFSRFNRKTGNGKYMFLEGLGTIIKLKNTKLFLSKSVL